MGFFSNLTNSWKKSSRLQELQKIIAPPGRTMQDVVSEVIRSGGNGMNERDRALEEFLDLCESDAGVKKVMETERLSRSDLKELYVNLSTAGLGQWIKGHYAALSTIAYAEPLQYYVRANKLKVNRLDILGNLLDYWEEKIPPGGLLRKV